MALTALEDLLRTSMGLSAASIGPAAIARAVHERLAVCRLADPHAYLVRVLASPAELQALIEAVVVPETWFFRDGQAFTAMARMARDEWLAAHAVGALTLLSLPCSTGEEPYSMAMALLDAGVPANRFRIDAVDISSRNLVRATLGVYGRNSFRCADLGFRDRHFDKVADGYRVKQPVRQHVRFHQGNLFAADLLPGPAVYDMVFCRNVLIYFDRPTQDRALVVLTRLLHPSGVLFVAPSETALPGTCGLRSTHEPLVFAFRKPSATRPAPKRPVAQAVRPPPVKPAAPRAAAAPIPRAAPPVVSDPASDLAEITRLADQGHFVEAATRCEQHLARWGVSSTAFYLLGLVRDASGTHAEAAIYYRKALYLEPDHYDAQVHLALLLETQGDTAGARVVRDRSRRLEQQRKPLA
jgi:chemotaxis protein methyltransferase WspC